MLTALIRKLFFMNAGKNEMVTTAEMELDDSRVDNSAFESAFVLGVMECSGCKGEHGNADTDLQVRLMDGDVYRVEVNDVSRTISKIHGLFCGKTIHVSGQINSVAKAIKLNKVRALGSNRGLTIRRLMESGGSSFHSDKVLRAGMF